MDNDNEYKYLRNMRIEQVEMENVEKLLKEKDDKLAEVNILRTNKINNNLEERIIRVEKQFKKYQTARRMRQLGRNERLNKK